MPHDINALGQPIGCVVEGWSRRPFPDPLVLVGRSCRVEPLDPGAHTEALHAANSLDTDGAMWTYLGYGPFASLAEYRRWLAARAAETDPSFYAIVDRATDRAVGIASYLRIDPANGVIEVGHLAYSPLLQRTAAATEAMYQMMKRVFDLGYRRYEWKCNALNSASRRAAQRLGFTFEGVFRQAVLSKGRNRDTAWYSILDSEWPAMRAAYEAWLDPANFDEHGVQRRPLGAFVSSASEPRV
jgi:RimJ/RimL family protein N-acetyltransferase